MGGPIFVRFMVVGFGWFLGIAAEISFAVPASNWCLALEENLGPTQPIPRTPARGRTKKLTAAFMEFKIDILDGVKVRQMNPPAAFDEKGKPCSVVDF